MPNRAFETTYTIHHGDGRVTDCGSSVDVYAATFSGKPVHFSPNPSATGPSWKRVAVCGAATRVGDSHRAGSSNLEHVTCPECLTRVVPYAPRQVAAT